MRYNIFADEASITDSRYMLIGGLWVPWDSESSVRNMFHEVRQKHALKAEMKWTKVSNFMLPAYQDYVDTFFAFEELSFKCILIDTQLVDYRTFHKNDAELGFYKFYFQLISRTLMPQNQYWLYMDERSNRKRNRLSTLEIIVNRWCKRNHGVEPLRTIEARQSHHEDFIQLADVLLGAISYAWHERKESKAKLALQAHIAQRIGWPTLRLATQSSSPKINIWKWYPSNKIARPNS